MRSWIACLALLFQVVSVAQAQQTIRVSVASDGTEANGGSAFPALSPNCRFVAFNAIASNLVEGDTNGTPDTFVHDRTTGETTRVSIASNGAQGNSESDVGTPALSDDGRFVAFVSASDNLVPLDTNGDADIFVHDRLTGETTRVSVASDGSQAVGSGWPSAFDISADGRFVAFSSGASNLVPFDTNGYSDIFVHDRTTGETTRVSVASDGSQAEGGSVYEADISADGRFVAFVSISDNLVPLDTNGDGDIFVHDRTTGETTRVSVASDGAQANDWSRGPALSADGQIVAFSSWASNLVPFDTKQQDIFVHDRTTGETTRVSVASDGAQANYWSRVPALSANGRVVVFISAADNLVSDDTNLVSDIFAHDLWTGKTVRVSLADNGDEANDQSSGPAICSNGRAFGFWSYASNLVQGDLNASPDVFIRDFGLFADSFESGDTSAWSDSVP